MASKPASGGSWSATTPTASTKSSAAPPSKPTTPTSSRSSPPRPAGAWGPERNGRTMRRPASFSRKGRRTGSAANREHPLPAAARVRLALGLHHRLAHRRQRDHRQLEVLQSERDADDGDELSHADQDVGQGDVPARDQEPDYVQHQSQ